MKKLLAISAFVFGPALLIAPFMLHTAKADWSNCKVCACDSFENTHKLSEGPRPITPCGKCQHLYKVHN